MNRLGSRIDIIQPLGSSLSMICVREQVPDRCYQKTACQRQDDRVIEEPYQ